MDTNLKPRRKRNPKKGALVLFAFFMALPLGYWLWGRYQNTSLQRQLDAYRAAGDPILPEDLNHTPISDETNAATDLRRAATRVDDESNDWRILYDFDFIPPLSDEELDLARRIVKASGPALDEVRSANAKAEIDWGVSYHSPTIDMFFPHLNAQRRLAQMIRLAALVAHQEGRDDDALQHVKELLFISRALSNEPGLVSHLVSLGISAMATDTLTDITSDLQIGTSGHSAVRAEVESELAELVDEKAFAESFQAGMRGERVFAVDGLMTLLERRIESNGSKTSASSLGKLCARPFLSKNARICASYLTLVMERVAQHPDWPGFDADVFISSADKAAPSIVSLLAEGVKRATKQQYLAVANRRLAATALGFRLYSIDHGGAFPESLQQLVPKYLPAILDDPMAVRGTALRYVTSSKSRLVYSVGYNGVDDGGVALDPLLPLKDQSTDEVRYISGRTKPPPRPNEPPDASAE